MRSRSHMIAMLASLGALGALAGVDALKSAESAPPSLPPPPNRRRTTAHPAAPELEQHNTSREQARRVRQMERAEAKRLARSGGAEHE